MIITQEVVLSCEELFNLYCTEIGKPRNQINWYKKNGWVDLEVFNWVRDIQGNPMPDNLGTIDELDYYHLIYCG